MEFLTIVLFLVSLYIGWNIGANDAANCMGTSVGAGILSYKKAVILVGIFALIGAVLQGSGTIGTIGNDIVDVGSMTNLSIVAALLGASLLITFFTFKGLPISTTNVVIGALVGIGFVTSVSVNWGSVSKIFIAWVFAPIASAILSYVSYHFLAHIFANFKLEFIQRRIYLLVIFSGVFLSYFLGANNVGNSMGLAVGSGIIKPVMAGLLGGIFIAIGSMTFGKNVMKTIGTGITELDSNMAFSAQMGTGLTVMTLTLLAIPVSTSTAIVGGVAGVGLVKGIATIDKGELFKIVRSWITTPLLGGVFAVILFKIFELL
ncbi:MAG: inorganic phosphate transporter [Nanoarchaeota archaeon]|nr:inorganic phosphate transporter [Nanoarchaeota archaeon]